MSNEIDNNELNIAEVEKVVDHSMCEDCLENYLFLMKDNYHEFYLPLSTALNCVLFASDSGIIPPVPNEWVIELKGFYQ